MFSFFTLYGVTFLAYNFCVKNIHSEDERKLDNMFDGYDSGENDIHFNKMQRVFSRAKFVTKNGRKNIIPIS